MRIARNIGSRRRATTEQLRAVVTGSLDVAILEEMAHAVELHGALAHGLQLCLHLSVVQATVAVVPGNVRSDIIRGRAQAVRVHVLVVGANASRSTTITSGLIDRGGNSIGGLQGREALLRMIKIRK